MKRLIWLGIPVFIVITLVLIVYWQSVKPLQGNLIYDAEKLVSKKYKLGSFIIDWDAENALLKMVSLKDTNKIVWQNNPNQPFINATLGEEEITEARGLFNISDELLDIYPHQTIDKITAYAQFPSVMIEGKLIQKNKQDSVKYTMFLTDKGGQEVRFNIKIADKGEKVNRLYLTYHADVDEHFFGFGEQFSHFDMKGKRIPIMVSEQGIGRGKEPITTLIDYFAGAGGKWYHSYAPVPQYISSKIHSVYLKSYAPSEFDFTEKEKVRIKSYSLFLDGSILYGENPTELISIYTEFAGRMKPLPDWILDGAVIGMQGGTDKVREVNEKLKKYDTPIAAFWLQDWVGQRKTSFGKQLWWYWQLDENHYPKWQELRKDLESQQTRMMIYFNPFLTDVTENENHKKKYLQEGIEKGYFLKDADKETIMILNTSFSAAMVDLSNPEAYKWLKEIMKKEITNTGASGWMADFGEAMPFTAKPDSAVKAIFYHNMYPEIWARLNKEITQELEKGDEMVFFMRSGYSQSPKYSTLFWGGDQLVTWDESDGIKTAVTCLLSSGLSGMSFNHTDIGGYTTVNSSILQYSRSKELLMRWTELNAFTSIFRTHEGNRPDDNVQVYEDDETLEHFSKFAKIYKAWAFYRKELNIEAAATGLPMVRHLFIHYPEDERVYAIYYQQFMVGSELIFAPVLDEGRKTVDVYLPKGKWRHLFTNEEFELEESQYVRVDAPIGTPAVFYKADTETKIGEQIRENLIKEGIIE